MAEVAELVKSFVCTEQRKSSRPVLSTCVFAAFIENSFSRAVNGVSIACSLGRRLLGTANRFSVASHVDAADDCANFCGEVGCRNRFHFIATVICPNAVSIFQRVR